MPKNKGVPDKARKGDQFMKQMGLLGGGDDDSDDDDMDLEAELLRLEGGDNDAPAKAKKQKVPDLAALQSLAANIDADIGSDEELSGDEDELMQELEGLSSDDNEEVEVEVKPAPMSPQILVTTLSNRISNYTEAMKHADGPKKRRYERAMKTLQSQLKTARSGKPVDESEIPPEVAIPKPSTSVPTTQPPTQSTQSVIQPAIQPTVQPTIQPTIQPTVQPSQSPHKPQAPSASPQAASSSSQDPRMVMLADRRNQYQKAALAAKQSGNAAVAMKYLRIRKDFDSVISALSQGQEVDLNNIPGPPSEASPAQPVRASAASAPAGSASTAAAPSNFLDDVPAATEEDTKKLFDAPDKPTDTMSALQQRLKKYQDSESEAKEQANTSKARRMGRIAKQYMDAIKATKAGKPCDYSELPTPPGFAEIPLPGAAPPQRQSVQASAAPAVSPPAASSPHKSLSPPAGTSAGGRTPSPGRPAAAAPPPQTKPKRQASLSIQEKQLEQLKERQSQYKKAAIEAKTHDDKELALKYMRVIKGMNPMIQAATNGLPVDMGQMPPPPAAAHQTGYVVVDASEIADITPEERITEFEKIITELKTQIKSSSDNAIHFKALGDVKQAFVFENLEQNCRKDIDAVQNALRHNDPVPKYHYETRQYSTVKVNTDLGDGDLQLKVIRGIQYPLPSEFKTAADLDTYINYELPWPQEENQSGKTEVCKKSDNPEYNHTDKFQINRRSKQMLRVFKNRKVKLEIFYRRGFLKSDKHFSTVSIKLDKFETTGTIHESFDLLDTNGRKEIGGKLEVELRMREPLSQKQVEVIKEKWLVIDQFVRIDRPVKNDKMERQNTTVRKLAAPLPPQVSNVKITSLEVLKFEKKELDNKIREATGKLARPELDKLTRISSDMTAQIDGITTMMRRNQLSPHEYIQVLSNLNKNYHSAIQAASQAGERRRYQILNIKKDIVGREIRAWQTKMSGK